MSLIARTGLLLSTVVCASLSTAADFEAGPYHDAHCMRCHDTGVYTRDDRRVRSFPALEAQVARCDANLATKLFPEDLELLVEHLNGQFYHFTK